MSKQEAIKAMREGKKVTHRYFTDDEFITINAKTGLYMCEMGYEYPSNAFWMDRTSTEWESDWSIYNK